MRTRNRMMTAATRCLRFLPRTILRASRWALVVWWTLVYHSNTSYTPQYPLSWASQVRAKSTPKHQWKVLIDAAAYVPTQPLDLSVVNADFVTVSFYKMFGYPTGLGALLIRTENVELLRKVFWGGGSVSLAVASDNFRVLQCEPTSRLEDGTVAFLDIISLRHGFSMLQSLGGMPAVQVPGEVTVCPVCS